ncbi:MAG: tetratricopeptide repeat protein [Fibromonadales bacterium]|nr:tetratricopeptide repeat protein [Fibromonadales bacterium]
MKYILLSAALVFCFASYSLAAPFYSPNKYQQNDWFGEFGGTTSMYINPAGIAEADQLEVTGGFFATISGAAMQEYGAIVFPYSYDHTFGLSFFENGATIITDPDLAQGHGDYLENAYIFGYAYRLFHWLAIGVNLSVLQVDQFGYNKQFTVGGDFGISWNPINNSRLGHVQLGISLQNLMQPVIKSVDPNNTDNPSYGFVAPSFFASVKPEEGYAIPSNLNVSLFYRGMNRALEVKAEASIVDIFPEPTENADAEGKPINEGKMLATSFSGTYFITPHIGAKLRWTKEGYPVIGGTVNVKDVSLFRYLSLDLEMSHDDIIEKKNRGFLWNVRAAARFGDTREESIGEARYRRLKIEPENDYRYAMRLYLNRDFIGASYAFGKVQTKYPTFHLVDQAAFYKGKSFENMRMHLAAQEIYRDAIRKYPNSDQVPKYHFQLMNIDYKEGRFSDAMAKHQFIIQNFPKSDVKSDADYVAGQIKFEQGQYRESIDMLSSILPGNANYFYARYTMGIAYSRQEKWDEAKGSFNDILSYQAANQSEKDLQDAAKIKLGHIFFSEPEGVPQAAKYYGQVTNVNSPFYEEAALALAWSFLKFHKTKEAKPFTQWIIKNRPNSYLISEAYLVLGYCDYLDKNFRAADKNLAMAIKLTENPTISKAQKDSANTAFGDMKEGFDSVQIRALDLARQLPTPRVEQKRAALNPDFERANREIETFADFQQRVIQSDRFDASRQRVLGDARLTKAIVSTELSKMPQPKGKQKDDGSFEVDDLDLDDL